MSEGKSTCLVVLTLIAAGTLCIVHYNHADYMLQRSCMDARGNWETRQASDKIGCRFPGKAEN